MGIVEITKAEFLRKKAVIEKQLNNLPRVTYLKGSDWVMKEQNLKSALAEIDDLINEVNKYIK